MGLTPEEQLWEEEWLDRIFTARRELRDTVPDLDALARIAKLKSTPTIGFMHRHTVPEEEVQAG